MYQERQSGFIFKNIILKLIMIVLIILLIVGLFPTKKYVENLINKKQGTNDSVVYNTNLQIMKEAAMSYYNGKRLPEKSEQLTLKQMIEKELLIPIKDKDNKTCDVDKSYVKVIKNDDDYTLTVNLVCGKQTKKIVSYFGDYDYCTSSICEKKKINNDTAQTTTTENKTNETSLNNENNTTSECQYVSNTNGYYKYSGWSNWSTNKVTASNTREVETKIEKQRVGTIDEPAGTKVITQNPKKVTATKNGQTFVVYVCPADFDNGGSYNTIVLCKKTVTNYVKKDTYKNILYYRYRDKNYVNGSLNYKWGSCNDNALEKQGYKKTGQTR